MEYKYIKYYFWKKLMVKGSTDIILLDEEQTKIIFLHKKGCSVKDIICHMWPKLQKEELSKAIDVIKEALDYYDSMFNINDKKYTGIYGAYYPMYLNIELTNSCNFACPFCYKNASKKCQDFLPNKILKDLELFYDKISLLHFTGGEPLLYPDFEKYLTKLFESFLINITTNLSLHRALSDCSWEKFNSIQVSLYGFSTESLYTHIKSKNFNDFLEGIERLKDLKASFYCMLLAIKPLNLV